MQTKAPFFDEVGKMMEHAVGLAQTAGEEAKSAFRAQADRWSADLDLVRRDDLDAATAVLRAEIAELRTEVARLSELSELRAEVARLRSSGQTARPTDDAG